MTDEFHEPADSLGCSGCGGCCDPVMMPQSRAQILAAVKSGEVKSRRWNREMQFILRNWTWTGERTHWWDAKGREGHSWHVQCAKYDRHLRRCTAYDSRPAACRGFPWYGQDPLLSVDAMAMNTPQCSYFLDVPAHLRPAGARPLIPIEVVSRRGGP